MYHTIEEFLADWKQESESTQKLLDLLTDESLSVKVKEGERKLGFLAWHITLSIHEIMSRTGLEFEAPAHDAPVPATAKEIADGYRQASQGVAEAVRTQWSDANLADESDMYGEMWPNANTLNMVVKHEIHHRGQLTVLMRLAGLPLVGMYGPSREDWASYGGLAPE